MTARPPLHADARAQAAADRRAAVPILAACAGKPVRRITTADLGGPQRHRCVPSGPSGISKVERRDARILRQHSATAQVRAWLRDHPGRSASEIGAGTGISAVTVARALRALAVALTVGTRRSPHGDLVRVYRLADAP